jgi:outer membrane protein assembly factor BamB
VVLVLLGSLPGCGAFALSNERAERGDDHVVAEKPQWFSRPIGAVQVTFRRELTGKGRTSGEDYEQGQPEVDTKNGRLFVGSADGGLYALRASDGSVIWRFQTTGPVQSEPYYDAELDTVYFGSHDGALYGVKAYDGSLVFRLNTGAEVARKVVHQGELLFVANAADHLFAIDRRSGKIRWQTKRPSALGKEMAGYAGPALADGVVYQAYSDGHVAAYVAQTGAERWPAVDLLADVDESGEAIKYLDADTTPIIATTGTGSDARKVLYVASYAGGVFALDARTGTRVFRNEQALGVTALGWFAEPPHQDAAGVSVPGRRILLAASAATGLWALDPDAQGRMLWRNPIPDGGMSRPVACAGTIVAATSRYGLFLLAPENGKVIDGVDPGSGFSQTPAVVGTRIFITSNGGTLFGMQVAAPRRGQAPLPMTTATPNAHAYSVIGGSPSNTLPP